MKKYLIALVLLPLAACGRSPSPLAQTPGESLAQDIASYQPRIASVDAELTEQYRIRDAANAAIQTKESERRGLKNAYCEKVNQQNKNMGVPAMDCAAFLSAGK